MRELPSGTNCVLASAALRKVVFLSTLTSHSHALFSKCWAFLGASRMWPSFCAIEAGFLVVVVGCSDFVDFLPYCDVWRLRVFYPHRVLVRTFNTSSLIASSTVSWSCCSLLLTSTFCSLSWPSISLYRASYLGIRSVCLPLLVWQ